MKSLHTQTIEELRSSLSEGTSSSVELVEQLFDVIEQDAGRVGAYISLNREQIHREALQADEQRAQHGSNSLLGIPISIKDLINVKGNPCTCSSEILKGYISPYDATVITKLREAGAVMFGRVNMDEFAMGSSTENAALGTTSNPWHLDHVPGGSSGGSAASVAADHAIASLGSDTGGSIRQPAAFCGCVGLKPTYGRVSRYGLTAFASSLDQIGPITKTVRDAALLLEVISGFDPKDATSLDAPVPDYSAGLDQSKSLKGMKLGLPREYFMNGIDPEVEQAVRAAVGKCRSLGAEIVDVSLPHTKYAISVYYIIATAEASANLARFDGIRYGLREEGANPAELYAKTRAAGLGPEAKRRIILGTYVLSSGYYDAYYKRAQQVQELIKEDFKKVFKKCDALLAPVTPTPAYRRGEKTHDPLKMYLDDILTTSVNLAGNCALSVPCGFSEAGLPIGLQVIGDHLREQTILDIAYQYEQNTDWHLRKPESSHE
ncbi:MAG: Asp-tRNA(Asn)/Glu-tRNA(Gln) amidotransferase GatCAB subunit A [Kiritimatiellaceae bacterium]|nr:Asp-tRNA(Asn)/Glu-tRNA(Gln) amidotransferase GatCAB subunit A [Kiritimatiellaceae bacterium]